MRGLDGVKTGLEHIANDTGYSYIQQYCSDAINAIDELFDKLCEIESERDELKAKFADMQNNYLQLENHYRNTLVSIQSESTRLPQPIANNSEPLDENFVDKILDVVFEGLGSPSDWMGIGKDDYRKIINLIDSVTANKAEVHEFASECAKSYKEHYSKCESAKDSDSKIYHEGCLRVAHHLFEVTTHLHGHCDINSLPPLKDGE